jgi:selenocysteine lyase/cysteine desulfurase
MIYLDNAATTFPKPECVYEALDKANRTQAFNAGRGESAESEKATSIISEARSCMASILPGTTPSHVVFTSSATDALNKLILGLGLLEGETVYVSPFEHNAIMRPLARFQKNRN